MKLKKILEQSGSSAEVKYGVGPVITKKGLPYDFDAPAKVLTLDMARNIGKYIGVDFDKIKIEDLYQGMKTEIEHKETVDKNPETTTVEDWITYAKIANDHLKESPKYYEALDKMGKGLKNEAFNFNKISEWLKKLPSADQEYAKAYLNFKTKKGKYAHQEPEENKFSIKSGNAIMIRQRLDRMIGENKINLENKKMNRLVEQKLRQFIRNIIKEEINEVDNSQK